MKTDQQLAQRNTFLAIPTDFELLIEILNEEGAINMDLEKISATNFENRSELVVLFPASGGVNYWPSEINLSDYQENSPRWRNALLAMAWQKQNPGKRLIDTDFSPVGRLIIPTFKNNFLWTAGGLNFPGSKIKETFPAFNKTIHRINRRIKKLYLVLDTSKKSNLFPFYNQIYLAGVHHKIYAFPAALQLLHEGKYFADYFCSDYTIQKYLNNLNIPGVGLP